jgi:hypothetical protein
MAIIATLGGTILAVVDLFGPSFRPLSRAFQNEGQFGWSTLHSWELPADMATNHQRSSWQLEFSWLVADHQLVCEELSLSWNQLVSVPKTQQV